MYLSVIIGWSFEIINIYMCILRILFVVILGYRWFHGKISREEAERRLNSKQNGLYLVRESARYPGDYCLSVWLVICM